MLLIPLLALFVQSAFSADHYPSFTELAKHEKEGVDYLVEQQIRKSGIAVLAIHGGLIEEGSDTLAKAVASTDLSFYRFIAMKPAENRMLHVTSHHFNDARAVQVVEASHKVLSIHGFKDDFKDEVCIGGSDSKLKDRFVQVLAKTRPEIIVNRRCSRFRGEDAQNIMNRNPKAEAVQLEISTHFRKRLEQEPEVFKPFVNLIRTALKD